MNPSDLRLIRETFALLAPITEQAAGLFYARLFELDPSLRQLFSGQMVDQGRKLMDMLAFAVHQLDQPDLLLPAVRQMGARHTRYGVRESHYETVGAALLWTLEQGLGPRFTPDVKQAWAQLYKLVADTMKSGARAQAA
jgi:hemoglobin-like flavoprotein